MVVWLVIAMAIVGNSMVLFVVGVRGQRHQQTRILVFNLALADLFMGVYLLVIGIVDATTIGEFSQHAVKWKESIGCQAIGTLVVFSCSLSLFTLTLITLERYATIIYAMKKTWLTTRRLHLFLCAGWVFALSMASLPLVGVNRYTKFAVCLPMDTHRGAATAYLHLVLTLMATSFIVIVACYSRIYLAVRKSPAGNFNNDYQVSQNAILKYIQNAVKSQYNAHPLCLEGSSCKEEITVILQLP